jgi:lysophospholipase L1-like esterase
MEAYLGAMKEAREDDGRVRTREYAEVMAKVAGTEGVPMVDFFDAFAEKEMAGDPPDLYADAYHPGPAGQRIMAETLFGKLEKLGF